MHRGDKDTMTSCTFENWTLEDLATALQKMSSGKKKISVPMFQRGKRWSKTQQQMFIDSLVKGYPVGTMLFYKRIEDNVENYILVDGLQRGNSIKLYLSKPTEFFYDSSISDKFCDSILDIIKYESTEDNRNKVRALLIDFIK